MASTYVNNLRLNEMATGDASGSWGTVTNTNLEIIGQAVAWGTRAVANASTDNITIADGALDADRCLGLKLTGGGQACTITLLPNTSSKTWIMYNATSFTLTFTCGSGANVAILAGETKIIATDGLGSGGVVYDLLTAVNLAGTTKTAALTNAGALSNQGTVTVGVDDTGYDVKFFGATSGKSFLWDESADSLIITGTTTLVGTTNLDAVDIDGATQIDATLTVGVDDTGYDVKLFGATSGAYMLWDESADDLKLVGAAGLTVAGDIDVDGTTNLDVVDIDGALTQDGGAVFNESGADVDFRVESDTNTHALFVEGSSGNVGITHTPDAWQLNNRAIQLLGGWGSISSNNSQGCCDLSSNTYNGGSAATSGWKYTNTGLASLYQQQGGLHKWFTAASGSADAAITWSESMRIDSSGNIIIASTGGTLQTATAGTSNFRAGVNAGNSIASGGNYNTVVGDEAGTAITTGDANTFVGYASGDATTTGSENTAVGQSTLTENTTGVENTAVGLIALNKNTTGGNNTALGRGALYNNTTADNNTAVGYNSLVANTTGTNNVAVGKDALDSNTTGDNNTAVGVDTLQANTTADDSTAVGHGALAVSTGASNTAVGKYAGVVVTTGAGHTLMGANAGDSILSGNNNTAVGLNAGSDTTHGSDNLFLGKDAGITGSPGGSHTTQSSRIVLGDENIVVANIQVDWTVASDARDKTDFTALDLGLDFVKALAPVTYKWDKRSKYGDKFAEGYDLNAQTPDGTHKEDWLDIGFKAQEVEALEIAAGYNKSSKTNLVSSHTGDGKQMGLQYSKFVPILVKAMQEQNALIEALTARITTLEG